MAYRYHLLRTGLRLRHPPRLQRSTTSRLGGEQQSQGSHLHRWWLREKGAAGGESITPPGQHGTGWKRLPESLGHLFFCGSRREEVFVPNGMARGAPGSRFLATSRPGTIFIRYDEDLRHQQRRGWLADYQGALGLLLVGVVGLNH